MPNIAQTIDDYLDDCRGRGLSLKTVEDSYGYSLRSVLLPWLAANSIETMDQIDGRVLLRWQGDLLTRPGKPLSRYSIRSWMRNANMFLRWAEANGEIAASVRGKATKVPRVLIDVLTREEIDLMEKTAKTERDKLIVRILADTGIRAGELLGLRVGDLIERDRNFYLRVTGKGSKERMVPVPRLGVRIRRFMRSESGRIFMTLNRKPSGQHEPLTVNGLQKLIRALAREARLTKRVHPHLLRHSYATWALSRGMNPIQLADILGHVGLTMIQRNYAHLSSRDAYDAQVRLFGGD